MLRVILWLFVLSCAVAADPLEDLRGKLASNDAIVRNTTISELVERWEELTADELGVVERLCHDADAEVAAAALNIRSGVELRRRFGPWIWERASQLGARLEGGAKVVDELEWAGRQWLDGRASDAELGQFLEEAWRLHGTCPPYSWELIQQTWGVRPFAKLFDAWIHSGTVPESDLVRAMNALSSADDPRFSPTLASYLESPDENLRYAAVDGLAKLRPPDVWPRIVPLLRDPAEHIRRKAIEALEALDAREAIAEVRKCLDDPGTDTVSTTLHTLGAWKDESSLSEFEKRLTTNPFAAANAIVALGERLPENLRLKLYEEHGENSPGWLRSVFGDHLTVADRDALIAMTGIEGSFVGLKATVALQRLLDPEEALALLEDQPAAVRRAVLPALERLPREKAIRTFRRLLKEDDDAWVRGSAASGLDGLGDRQSAPDIALLLNSQNEMAWLGAHFALSGLGAVEQAPAVTRGLRANAERQRMATRWIEWVDARDRAPEIRELAAAGTGYASKRATELLIDWSGPRDAEWLVTQLGSDNPEAQRKACDRLVRLGCTDLVWNWLLDHRDDDGLIPESTLVALLDTGQPRAVELVMSMPAHFDGGHTVVGFREPFLWAVAHARPMAFAKMPSPLRKAIVRRLRNLARRPYIEVEMLARIALARLGELDVSQLKVFLDDVTSDDRFDFNHPGRNFWRADALRALNAALEPASWEILHRPFTPSRQIVTEADLSTALATADLALAAVEEHVRCRTAPGVTTTLADILERQNPHQHLWCLEGKTVRFVRIEEASAYWRRRLAER